MNDFYVACFLLTAAAMMCPAQAPPTIAQALAKRGLGTSTNELRTALTSSDPDIRGLAAGQLAANGDRVAIPALIEALQQERDTLERFNLARALNVFDNPEGAETMVQLCTDHSVPNYLRIEAADPLPHRGNEACFPSVVDILSSSDNPAERLAALSFIEHAHSEQMRAYDTKSLADVCARALRDYESSVRQSAAECIALYDLMQDSSQLRVATESETDSDTKRIMREAEQKLAAKHKDTL